MKATTRKPKTALPVRARILVAAGNLFHSQGIRGIGVEAIAEAADTNKMTLYRHFPSKDELIAEWARGQRTVPECPLPRRQTVRDRKSTRLNSSHSQISYAVFCLKKKKKL